MKRLSRRAFIGTGAIGLGSALFASRLQLETLSGYSSKSLKLPLGFQAWTIRQALAKDFPGTLSMMAEMGYKSIEMCSPPGYQFAGFAPLMKYTAKEMKQIISDAGLTCISSHYVMNELRDNLDERINYAAESGQTQMILSSFSLPQKPGMDDWKKAAAELNTVGEKVKAAGLQMGFHNHHFEFQKIDGVLIYDELMKVFDPELIKLQFQVAVINIGYKAADYFKKYPGRFISAHLADWSAEKKKEAPVGQGIVDWKEFFAALETGGVKNVFVEMGQETFKESASYLLSL